nr:probable cinnamyl alcohol dehydrogenase 6 [Ipomoea batatas]
MNWFTRSNILRQNGPTDVTIKVLFCGICHTDIHHIKNDWGITMYPVVPGHEITGIITKVGSEVSNFKIGDKVGVGCLAATCLKCEFCKDSQENYCDQVQFTYNGIFWDGSITYGGYSNILVADHRYVVRIPENLAMDKAAPLLCAGITVYCPMKDNKLFESKGKRVGIIGLGGLGHVAVKFAKALGHHVTVISTSPSKEKEAKDHLGADDFIISTNPKHMQDFDYLDTVRRSQPPQPPFAWDLILEQTCLKLNGTPGGGCVALFTKRNGYYTAYWRFSFELRYGILEFITFRLLRDEAIRGSEIAQRSGNVKYAYIPFIGHH